MLQFYDARASLSLFFFSAVFIMQCIVMRVFLGPNSVRAYRCEATMEHTLDPHR